MLWSLCVTVSLSLCVTFAKSYHDTVTMCYSFIVTEIFCPRATVFYHQWEMIVNEVALMINLPVKTLKNESTQICLILKFDGLQVRLVGGASLIAPKVVVTAAHKIRY